MSTQMGTQTPVYRHVVLFQFNDDTPESTVQGIEVAFRKLCAELPFVTGFEWGRNSSPENLDDGFTHCFLVTFADAHGRDTYLPHPAHVAFCTDYLDEHLKKVCVIDYLPNY